MSLYGTSSSGPDPGLSLLLQANPVLLYVPVSGTRDHEDILFK